jgi:Tfp pilus assembly protein PilF
VAQAHLNIGCAYLAKGKFDSAIASFEQALTIDPQSSSAHDGIGCATGEKGDFDSSMKGNTQ